MSAKGKADEFQVALLIDDIQETKRISDALRELGIFAHYYQDLDEMWVALNAYTPGFCIVDVKKMSDGKVQFKSHPKVKNQSLKIAFYYKDTNKILLSSTAGINHYGLIRDDLDLSQQLQAIINRRTEERKLEEQINDLTSRVSRLKVRGNRLTEKQEEHHHKIEQLENLNDLIRQVGRVQTQHAFYQRILHVFSNWESCLEFGMYYLNNSKQKLVSPKGLAKSYKQLPDLWLNDKNSDGIDGYAQEMASDICFSEIEGELVNIRIEGLYNGPDILIWGKFEANSTKYFHWDLLEEKLNSEYRKIILLERDSIVRPKTNSIHNLLYELDEIQFNQVQSKYRYALIDFSGFLTMVRNRPKLRLNWKQFISDFSMELEQIFKNSTYRLTPVTPGHFVFSIGRENLEQDFQKLKAYLQDLELWRYFNDNSVLMNIDIAPKMSLISPSSVNLIRQIEDSSFDFMEETTPQRTSQMTRPTV